MSAFLIAIGGGLRACHDGPRTDARASVAAYALIGRGTLVKFLPRTGLDVVAVNSDTPVATRVKIRVLRIMVISFELNRLARSGGPKASQ